MKPVQSVFARLVGRPAPESLPPVSKGTIARAESTAAESVHAAASLDTPAPVQARPAPTPALLAKPRVPAATAASATREEESPAVTALRMEVQQLRLLRTFAGNRELAARLWRSETARAALDTRLSDLQTANESLTAQVRESALENERLINELIAARLAARQ